MRLHLIECNNPSTGLIYPTLSLPFSNMIGVLVTRGSSLAFLVGGSKELNMTEVEEGGGGAGARNRSCAKV